MSIENYAEIVTAVITIANIITASTPSKSDNKILNSILKILNIVSLNIGKNKNADDVEEPEIEIPVDVEDFEN